MKTTRNHKVTLSHPKGDIEVVVKSKHAATFAKIQRMKFVEGTKVLDLMADVFRQGRKVGAREAFEGMELLK